MQVHEFERGRHSFEGGAAIAGSDSDSEDDDAPLSPDDASQDLFDLLVGLKLRGALSAKQVCTIAHLATTAGLKGIASQLAFRLGAPTGHYNRHVKTVLTFGRDVDGSYGVKILGHDKRWPDRMIHSIPSFVPHEVLSQELE